MSRITEPPSSLGDAFTKGDTAIGHSPDMVAHYRDLATQADIRREALAGGGQQAAPEVPALPMTHVARQHAGKEVSRLACQVEAGRREVGRLVFTASGAQVSDPAVLAMRAELVQQIEAAEAEISRLGEMSDDQVRQWAGARGVR
jgi:hypothetical protein